MSFEIYGVGNVPTNYVDYTNPTIVAEYKKNMEKLFALLSKQSPLTDEEITELQQAMKNLQKLAEEGNNGGDPSAPQFMTVGMLATLSEINKALAAEGILSPDYKGTSAQWESAKSASITVDIDGDGNLETMELDAYITKVTVSETINATMSIIAMLELEFFPDTFDDFAVILGGLKDQMEVTENILETLNVIMSISNMVKSGSPSGFKVIPTTNGDIDPDLVDELANYMNTVKPGEGTRFKNVWNENKKAAEELHASDPVKYPTVEDAFNEMTSTGSAADVLRGFLSSANDVDGSRADYILNNIYSKHFDQVTPIPNPTENAAYELLEARKSLNELLEKLDAQILNSEDPPQSPPPSERVNSLNYYLKNVIEDIDAAFEGIDITGKSKTEIDALYKTAVSNWIMDSQDKASGDSSRGAIYSNLSRALELTKNTNDQQNADFKLEYQNFTDFVKFALTALEGIYKLFKGMSDGIR